MSQLSTSWFPYTLHIKPRDGLERQSWLFCIFIAQPQLPGTKASLQHFCGLLLASIIKASILIAKVLLEVGLISRIVGSLVKVSRSEEVEYSDTITGCPSQLN